MKIRESRKILLLCCMLGFLLGIFYANLISEDYILSTGIFSEFFLNQYSQTEIDTLEYLWYVVRIRMTPVALTAALGCTKLRKAVVVVVLLWTGFSGGLLMTAAVMKMGIKGVFFCIVALIPHMFFYAAGYLILLWYFFVYPKSRWNLSKTVSMILFLAVGILLESYVNPVLMEWFLRTLQ